MRVKPRVGGRRGAEPEVRTLLIGYGAIARAIRNGIADDRRVSVTHVLVRPERKDALQRELGAQVRVVANIEELKGEVDCAVECAGHSAATSYVPDLLRSGVDVVLVSTGSLSQPGLAARLEDAASHGRAQLVVVPGAVAGIEALSAARNFGLDSVTYVGRKPPQGWRGTPAEAKFDLSNLDEPTTIFEGSAREAAELYPKNANVAATIGLAGIGLDATRVRLIADPGTDRNHHLLRAEGTFGSLEVKVGNNPLPDNPKTSALAACSAVRALRNRAAAVVI